MIEDVLFLCLSGKAKKLIHQLLRRNKFVSFGKKVEHFVSFPTHSDAAAPQTSGSPVRMGFHAFKLHRYASAQRNFYFFKSTRSKFSRLLRRYISLSIKLTVSGSGGT